jgi:recombination protein RecT
MPPVSKVALCAIDKTPPNDESAIATLKDLFSRQTEALSKIAAKHLTSDRLARIAVNCVSKAPRLLECTPVSVLQSVMAGAAMGLEAGGPLGEGYLIPRWNSKKGVTECQFLAGYKGLISLARRSGHVLSIEADVVYEADVWQYSKTEMGTNFTHVPSETAEPGDVRLAYAVARLKDTPLPVVVVMYRREIEKIRLREKKRGESPWDTDYAEMCKKTGIRRICKYMPMSIELAGVLDSEAEDDDRDVIDVTPSKPPKQERHLRAADEAPEISEPHVDASESQELPPIEPIGDVLAGIAALRTSAECAAHSERMKSARWENEDDRKAAVDMFKARWKAVLAEEKAAMKAATTAPAKTKKTDENPMPDWAQKDERDNAAAAGGVDLPDQGAAKAASLTRCDECGLLKGHDVKCTKKDVDTRTIDWVKEHEISSPPKLMGLKDPPPGGPAIKLSDGSYADPRTLDGDEIQGREREPGEEG